AVAPPAVTNGSRKRSKNSARCFLRVPITAWRAFMPTWRVAMFAFLRGAEDDFSGILKNLDGVRLLARLYIRGTVPMSRGAAPAAQNPKGGARPWGALLPLPPWRDLLLDLYPSGAHKRSATGSSRRRRR